VEVDEKGILEVEEEEYEYEEIEEYEEYDEEDKNQSIDCPICLVGYPKKEMTHLQCGHFYCLSCLIAQFNTLIMEAKVKDLSCPNPQCDAKPSEKFLKKKIISRNV